MKQCTTGKQELLKLKTKRLTNIIQAREKNIHYLTIYILYS